MNTNSLTGTLPSELGRFSKMRTEFVVTKTKINGTLPTQLGALATLSRYFNLYSNELTGTMPTEFGMLKKMEWVFKINGNKVTGAIPTEVGDLSDMYGHFHLSSNALCSDIPTEFAALSTSLNLSTYPSADPTYWSVAEGNFVGPTPCPAVSALVALYEGTGGAAWTSNDGWMGDPDGKGDPCTTSWYGVTCSSDGEVTRLHAVNNNLNGTLPTQLGDLTLMTIGGYPDVHYNALFYENLGITGSLPSGS